MPKTQAKPGLSPRELDALRKRYLAEQKQAESASKWQLANDIASGINDIVGRGVIAPIAGGLGDVNQALWDAGAWVNNKIKDVEVATGMVKQPRYVQPTQGNAYLGSEDIGNRMERAGLVSSERRPMTELAASLVSPSAAAKTAINAPKTAMNMLRMVENLEAPSRGVRNAQGMYIPRGQVGAIENLYHGSPHTFDRFDLSKIGTGEGAQAYGHGAYLAEGKGVAETYKKDLSGFDELTLYTKDGKKKGQQLDDVDLNVAKYLEQGERMAGQYKHNTVYYAKQEAQKAGLDDVVARLDEYGRDAKVGYEKNTGNLYQTRLAWPDAREATDPLSPEHFLDWDKPLSEQSPYVQNAVKPILKDLSWDDRGYGLTEYFGSEDFPMELMDDHGKWSGRAVNTVLDYAHGTANYPLSEVGIPGIRYLDAGSRGAGKGTSNYVVFDDKLIDIQSRNGQPIVKPVNVWHGTDIEFDTPKTPLFLGDRSLAEAYAADRAAASGFNPVVMGGTANFKKTATDADVKKVAESLGIEENDMAFMVLDPNISGKGVSDRVINALKAKGFDSAYIDDFSPQDPFTLTKSYVAFDSNQLKLKKVDK